MATIIGEKTAEKETEDSMRTRIANCSKEIEDVLIKYNCTLQVNQGVGVMPLK